VQGNYKSITGGNARNYSADTASWNKVSGDRNGKESYNSSVKDDWTYFSSNQRMKPQHTRRNLRQLSTQTLNQLEPLSNLNEDCE
jgi:hypothetical protein